MVLLDSISCPTAPLTAGSAAGPVLADTLLWCLQWKILRGVFVYEYYSCCAEMKMQSGTLDAFSIDVIPEGH